MEVPRAEIARQLVLRDAVDIVVHGGQQLGVAVPGHGDVRVHVLPRQQTGDQGAARLIDVILQPGPGPGGHVGLAGLHRLHARLGVVTQEHRAVFLRGDLLLQPLHHGDGLLTGVAAALGGVLGIGQARLDGRGAVDKAQPRAHARGEGRADEGVVMPVGDHLLGALPVGAKVYSSFSPAFSAKLFRMDTSIPAGASPAR